ncbi:MAG: tetratricopeptide repeat protein [Saprospirales bacterium]|nr:tetratricopeptide repeat protein [Saprospirales bacterium]
MKKPNHSGSKPKPSGKKALGKEHPTDAASLNNLAILYTEMGQYGKAEPLWLEAKAIREKHSVRNIPIMQQA